MCSLSSTIAVSVRMSKVYIRDSLTGLESTLGFVAAFGCRVPCMMAF